MGRSWTCNQAFQSLIRYPLRQQVAALTRYKFVLNWNDFVLILINSSSNNIGRRFILSLMLPKFL